MVLTRSQSRVLAAKKVAPVVSAPAKKVAAPKREKETVYRNFVIRGSKYKTDVDKFYLQIEQYKSSGCVLTNFWNTTTVSIPEIPVECHEKLLFTLIDNKAMWEKLENVINREVVPFEDFLKSPDIQTKIKSGQTRFSFKVFDGTEVLVDLSPLNEFSYWIKLLTKLLVAVDQDLLTKCSNATTKVAKAQEAKHIYEVNVACRQLICHKYAFCGLRFYAAQLLKLIELFNEGLEFTLYAFGIFCPEMINENVRPFINHENLWRNDELAVSDNDQIFGEAKKKFKKYY